MTPPGTADNGPLSGLVVADFSRILAGPYATMMLADLGADVIKVEGPGGDDTRTWTPPTRDGESTYYLGVNRNKRSIALDLADPGDRAVAQRLAARADVMVQNFRHGGLERFGLDHEAVRTANPGVVYASITGFGSGDGAGLPGYDLMVQGISGLMSLTGDADGPPMRAGVAVCDVITGLHAAVGILAALQRRAVTGLGEHVEVDLLSSTLSGLVNQSSAVVAGGVVPSRMGNAHPSIFPYNPLPTADGHIIVIAANDGQFATLAEVLGRPGLATDPRFATNADRTANRDELEPHLVDVLRTRTTAEWFEAFRAAGLPGGPVHTVAEGVAFAESLGLSPVVDVGGVPSIRNPIGLDTAAASYRHGPPSIGQHDAEIRAWLADG
ncbi:CaiB/BaiF CoA transferase family protein [Euzebya rosea]|uniref:CaiB/BaiF CoA transferase family protein n=1 Tax=Euzebya rosea TaxID=2052804 RepID=UPI000D3E5B79|nr:CoA transferase [Euzebya rosea]